MPKLFVFGIGGTGARVIKSLTMLLAAGIKTDNFDVIPILIDPHESLQEQNNCKKLLKLYADIHQAAYKDIRDTQEQGFFRTTLSTLAGVAPGTGIRDGFAMEGNYGITFDQFLERKNLSRDKKTSDLLSLLYSEQDNFKKSLSMGFKGNPNVGSIVLNAMGDSPLFKAFEGTFGPEDRIFIVSSIFGGTGAAGFPLLLKNFRQHTNAMIREARVGALTVMPYFKLGDPGTGNGTGVKSDIDSKNFLIKTKSALAYYIRNITNLNALYYIADPHEQSKAYKNDEENQPDTAHLVELLGALAIVHFASNQFTSRQQQIFEYCLKSESKEVHFKNIGDETTRSLALPLTTLYMFNRLHKAIKQREKLPFRKTNGFDARFFSDPFFSNLLEEFLDHHFEPWIKELADNERGFSPFNGDKAGDFMDTVKGYKAPRKILPGLVDKPFDHSDMFVNMARLETGRGHLNANPKNKYLSMAYGAIQTSVKENLSF